MIEKHRKLGNKYIERTDCVFWEI